MELDAADDPFAGHGGALRSAVRAFGGNLESWLDLSTAIAPWRHPAAKRFPARVVQRLPEADDGLKEAICSYYGAPGLAVPGTQSALQLIALSYTPRRVLVPLPSFSSYREIWQLAFQPEIITTPLCPEAIEEMLPCCDALILASPNNPTGHTWPLDTLKRWHETLLSRNDQGLLIIDEAFADAREWQSCAGSWQRTPSPLPAWASHTKGVVVLRSLGKFFGLAGLRIGVMFAHRQILTRIAALLGPWGVSHPARWAATKALQDQAWQQRQAIRLYRAYDALARLLKSMLSLPILTPGLAPYACVLRFPHPLALARRFARRHLLVRPFEEYALVRIGVTPPRTLELLRSRIAAMI